MVFQHFCWKLFLFPFNFLIIFINIIIKSINTIDIISAIISSKYIFNNIFFFFLILYIKL